MTDEARRRLDEAKIELNRARGEITDAADDRLIDALEAIIRYLELAAVLALPDALADGIAHEASIVERDHDLCRIKTASSDAAERICPCGSLTDECEALEDALGFPCAGRSVVNPAESS